jgi:hypothetical protein
MPDNSAIKRPNLILPEYILRHRDGVLPIRAKAFMLAML